MVRTMVFQYQTSVNHPSVHHEPPTLRHLWQLYTHESGDAQPSNLGSNGIYPIFWSPQTNQTLSKSRACILPKMFCWYHQKFFGFSPCFVEPSWTVLRRSRGHLRPSSKPPDLRGESSPKSPKSAKVFHRGDWVVFLWGAMELKGKMGTLFLKKVGWSWFHSATKIQWPKMVQGLVGCETILGFAEGCG